MHGADEPACPQLPPLPPPLYASPLHVPPLPSPSHAVLNGVPTLYRNAWECAAKAVVLEGPQALYKGCTAQLLRVGPHTVLTLLLLDHVQRALLPQGPRQGRHPGGASPRT